MEDDDCPCQQDVSVVRLVGVINLACARVVNVGHFHEYLGASVHPIHCKERDHHTCSDRVRVHVFNCNNRSAALHVPRLLMHVAKARGHFIAQHLLHRWIPRIHSVSQRDVVLHVVNLQQLKGHCCRGRGWRRRCAPVKTNSRQLPSRIAHLKQKRFRLRSVTHALSRASICAGWVTRQHCKGASLYDHV